jgi:hypothetical protein
VCDAPRAATVDAETAPFAWEGATTRPHNDGRFGSPRGLRLAQSDVTRCAYLPAALDR